MNGGLAAIRHLAGGELATTIRLFESGGALPGGGAPANLQ